jgi:hypothetical protein
MLVGHPFPAELVPNRWVPPTERPVFHRGLRFSFSPGRAKQLFKIIVGPRQIGNIVTMEQSRPVTVGDFQKLSDDALELVGFVRRSTHVTQENATPPTNRRTAMLFGIVENTYAPMNKTAPGSRCRP